MQALMITKSWEDWKWLLRLSCDRLVSLTVITCCLSSAAQHWRFVSVLLCSFFYLFLPAVGNFMENNTDSLNTDLLKNMKQVMSFVEKSGQVSAIPWCNAAAVNTFPVCMKNLETECQAYLLPIPDSIQKKEEIILKRVDIFIHIAQ